MNNINNINVNDNMSKVIEAQKNQNKVKNDSNKEINHTNKEKPAAVFEKSDNKTSHIYNKEAITNLKRQTEENKAKIIQLVTNSLKRQGKNIDILNNSNDFSSITNIDEEARIEAEKLISEDGELGVEKTSQRLVDFAIAISGGDKSKAGILKDAIEKGFKEAEKIFGGKLPQISKDTYDKTMEKFNAYFYESENTEE